MRRVMLCTTVLATLTVALVTAQQPPSPTFEVASIRSAADLRGDDDSEVQPSGRFVVTNAILYDLTRFVFQLKQHEIAAGERLPSWVRTDRWDIIGKGPPVTDETAQQPIYLRMMQNL